MTTPPCPTPSHQLLALHARAVTGDVGAVEQMLREPTSAHAVDIPHEVLLEAMIGVFAERGHVAVTVRPADLSVLRRAARASCRRAGLPVRTQALMLGGQGLLDLECPNGRWQTWLEGTREGRAHQAYIDEVMRAAADW